MLGAGGHARVLQEILAEQGIDLDGFLAPSPTGSTLGDVSWLGADEALAGLDPHNVLLVNGLGSASSPSLRRAAYVAAKDAGFAFRTVIDGTAIVKASALLGEGVQVLAGAIVGTRAVLRDDVLVNTGAIVDHDSVVGSHSHIATGAALAGSLVIGEETHIGLGARVIQGLTVGSGSTVGAGAVVIRSVPDSVTATGVPASFGGAS